jgi:acylphosphatase
MKLRITITGPKVHDVGYRYLLLGGAMSLRLPGFDANNFTDGKTQIVDVVVEGKEPQIAAFKKFVENNRPADAEVSDITISDYDGDVMKTSEYSQIITALQLLKAIPAVLKIEKNTALIPQIVKNTDLIPQMAKNTEKILEEVKGLREEIQPGLGEQLRQMQADIRALKDRAGII